MKQAAKGWRIAIPCVPVAVFSLISSLCAVTIFNRATTPWSSLPDNDYWYNIHGLIGANGVRLTLENLFHHNNEHIIVIPKLIYAVNYWLTSGSNVGLVVYSLVVGSACAGILFYLALPLFHDAPARGMLCAALFPLVIFSTKLSHISFLGMSGPIWLTADVFVILSAAALARAVAESSNLWLSMALLAGVLGVLSYSTAVYSLLAILVTCGAFLLVPRLRGKVPWLAPASVAAVVILVLGFGAIHRNLPASHPAWSFNILELARFVLVYIGTAVVVNGHLRWVIGFVILSAGFAAIVRLALEGRIGEMLTWIVLFFYAPLNGLMTGVARLGFGSETASSSRYQSVTAISLIAAITLVLTALPKGIVPRRVNFARGAIIAIVAALGILIATDRSLVRKYVARNEAKAIAEIAIRHNLEGRHHLQSVTRAFAQLGTQLSELRAAQHVPFHWQSHCEDLLGTRVGEARGPMMGAVESVSLYHVWNSEDEALELSGWAEQGGSEADCIVIIDGARNVIGAGTSISERPDIERARRVKGLGRVGWKAVATTPGSTPICALAFFPDDPDEDGPWEPLGGCLSAWEGIIVDCPACK
jgi:hypothetical protein